MRRRQTRLWLGLGVAGALVAALVAWPVVHVAFTYGCRDADHDLARQLAASRWLEVVPPGASPAGPSTVECDDDDRVASGVRSFTTSSVPGAVDFYAEQLEGDGWRPAEESTNCWIWSDGPRESDLRVSEHPDGPGFDVELSSSVDGQGGWCD